jgi:hypothetical protein
MASESVIDAVITKWATSITTAGLPQEIWLDEVPTRRADGSTIDLPTIVIHDGGTVPSYELEKTPLEVTTLTFVVRALTLPAADAIVKRMKYGGGAVGAGLGFDFTASLPFAAGIRLYSTGMLRSGEGPRRIEAFYGPGATAVYRVDVGYTVSTIRTGV